MNASKLQEYILSQEFSLTLEKLYGAQAVEAQTQRYQTAVKEFCQLFGDRDDLHLFSVPGRSEISGNHTDHNHGKVIAASVDLDIIAVAAPSTDAVIRVKSEGFPMDSVKLGQKESYPQFTSAALIAGVVAGMEKRGYAVCGFDAYTTSNVFKGSGLSSSAAFENMIGTIENHFCNQGTIPFVTISQISQYAENAFFGKPSGLMDQIACAAGGFVGIDFEDPEKPQVQRLDFDLTEKGYALAIVNTGGNHANLNDDYAGITLEMKAVSQHFGKNYLCELSKEQVLASLPELREKLGDRAVLRALHFFNENQRVTRQLNALEQDDLNTFFQCVTESGRSSLQMLQNVYSPAHPEEQGLTLALSLCPEILDADSVWRVHGGGFAGTILVFVPLNKTQAFRENIERFFGKGSCFVLRVRTQGALCLTK